MNAKIKKEGVSKKERIKNKSQFNIIFKNGKKIASKKLKIYFIRNDINLLRFSIITSKKLGNAVRRNRIKRVIKEVYRRNKEYFGSDMDWIFIPKGKWEKIDYYNTERLLLDVIEGIKKKKKFLKT